MSLSSPGVKKKKRNVSTVCAQTALKYFPAVIKYKTCTLVTHSSFCPFAPFVSASTFILCTLSLCQVNSLSLFVWLAFTSFHLLILSLCVGLFQFFFSVRPAALDLWLFVSLCCLSLGFCLFRSLEPSHLFVLQSFRV